MNSFLNGLGKFFGVIIRPQTYLNLLYLLLALPLGLFYFTFLIVGLTAGIPLIIVWVGLLILAVVYALWYAMIYFERQLAITLLREPIPPVTRQDMSGKSLWKQFTATLSNPVTWKGLVYLLAKFPVGLASFVVLVTLLAVSLSLVGMPFYYPTIHFDLDLGAWTPILTVDTLGEALIGCLLGIFATLISLHILNGVAWLSGKFARLMLGNFSTQPAAPSAPAAPAREVAAVPAVEPIVPETVEPATGQTGAA
ncbi:MAG TPA: sensor domain-containing protein [Anaerolinea sp.]|nr:sensor domain-containing protein [Anaerolinea sp.]